MNTPTSMTEMQFAVDCSGIAKHWGLVTEYWWDFDRARRDGLSIRQATHSALQEWDLYTADEAFASLEGFGTI